MLKDNNSYLRRSKGDKLEQKHTQAGSTKGKKAIYFADRAHTVIYCDPEKEQQVREEWNKRLGLT